MAKIIATWEDNDMTYTLMATPIEKQNNIITDPSTDMLSVYEYFGGTPPHGMGEKIYRYAKDIGAKTDTHDVATPRYTGKIMMYERSFLDTCGHILGEQHTLKKVVLVEEKTVKENPVISDTYDDDDLPF
jgi:hypothetical protein